MFSEFFFERIQSTRDFELRGINLVKLYYDRFVAYESGSREWAMKPVSKYHPSDLLRSCFRLAALIFRRLIGPTTKGKCFLYGSSGRLSTIDGKTYDLYDARLVETFGKEHFYIYQDSLDTNQKIPAPDLVLKDALILFAFFYIFVRLAYGREVKRFVQKILSRYPELGFQKRDAERFTFSFCADFLSFRFLLQLLQVRRVLLTCHYTREAFICACKRINIPVTEIMHGHINRTHAYYDMPLPFSSGSERSLLPDKILVYGEYWRQILIEKNFLPSENIQIGGYYLKLPLITRQPRARQKKKILLTTQPTVQPELLNYVKFLKENLDPDQWELIIKPHPAEKSQPYHQFEVTGLVTVSYENTYSLLSKIDVHITAYSTLVYEAVLYQVCNYALYVEKVKDRWLDVIDSGVARPLQPDEIPAIYPLDSTDRLHFFADFNPAIFHSACMQAP